ncbi:hypothetical protein [Tabrizicola sp.]|nr:hypothetical protein [Tabrizicola sp.]MDP3196816.1 hypothetical protein [Tabrizicola sp.]
MRAILFCLTLATTTLAEGWRVLDDAGITLALSVRGLQYEDGTTQTFF